jgi:hypothetical protein
MWSIICFYLNSITSCFSNAAGRHSYDLLYAAVKTAVLSPHYQCLFPLPYYKEVGEIIYDMGAIAAELIDHPSNHAPPSDNAIPLRYAVCFSYELWIIMCY